MKDVLVLRHAKSSWSDAGLPDHERPLKPRGQRDAPEVGRQLRHRGLVPDRILSSTAVRAQTTARLVASACAYDGVVELVETLYHGGPPAYLASLQALPDDVARVLLVGHNPDVGDLTTLLSGEHVVFATASLVHLRIAVDAWRELRPGVPATIAFGPWTPSEPRKG